MSNNRATFETRCPDCERKFIYERDNATGEGRFYRPAGCTTIHQCEEKIWRDAGFSLMLDAFKKREQVDA